MTYDEFMFVTIKTYDEFMFVRQPAVGVPGRLLVIKLVIRFIYGYCTGPLYIYGHCPPTVGAPVRRRLLNIICSWLFCWVNIKCIRSILIYINYIYGLQVVAHGF